MKLTFTLIALFSCCLLNAQKAGTLDSSFGTNGKAITFFPNGYFIPTNAASQKDGKIISGGTGGYGLHTDTSEGFAAIRYNFDGTLDSSLGIDGEAVYKFKRYYGGCGAVAVQNDNKIVLAGWGGTSRSGDHANDSVLITRLNADGSLDGSFGNDGEVITSVGNGTGPFINCLAIQADGKIVAGGQRGSDFLVMRYSIDGKPDLSFGENGFIDTHISGGVGSVSAIALQPYGKILAAGNTSDYAVLVRYMPNGMLDSSFATNGISLQKFQGGYPSYDAVDINSDGSIITAGSVGGPANNMLAAKFASNGHLDETFGMNGSILLKISKLQSQVLSIIIENDKKIILSGSAFKTFSSGSEEFAMWRLTENGIVDSSFGINGMTTTDFGANYLEYVIKSFEENNKIFTIGSVGTNADGGFPTLLARYNNDDLTKKQIIIKKIKHYIQTHNDAQATTLNSVSIYPNPAQNILHVEDLSSTQTKLTVVDFAGNIAISQQLSANSQYYNLNIASLHAGNYLLKIEMNGEVATKQFVKE